MLRLAERVWAREIREADEEDGEPPKILSNLNFTSRQCICRSSQTPKDVQITRPTEHEVQRTLHLFGASILAEGRKLSIRSTSHFNKISLHDNDGLGRLLPEILSMTSEAWSVSLGDMDDHIGLWLGYSTTKDR